MTQTNNLEIKKEFNARSPDFKGDGVAVWINTDKNGKPYAAVKLFNRYTVNCFSPRLEKTVGSP